MHACHGLSQVILSTKEHGTTGTWDHKVHACHGLSRVILSTKEHGTTGT